MAVEDDLQTRLDYLQWTDEDRSALVKLRPVLEEHADELVSAFYRHLLGFEPTRNLLSNPEVRDRLLTTQREYLLSLASGRIDEQYIESRRKIGAAHERVGLEPRWYLGAYGVYVSILLPLIADLYRGQPDQLILSLNALNKLQMLDSQLAMETYITRREEQLEFLARELAATSRELERSYDKQGGELRETAERARAAERLASIGALVAGLAHEIGTPMGVIQGHAEMLESSVSDDRGHWRLKTIREQIDRISRIIHTLLDIARPRPTEFTQIDLSSTIQDCLSFVAEKLQKRGIQIETRLPDEVTIEADFQKLQQLFLNLFLNAADAMPDGGTLQVGAERIGSREVEIVVSDTGRGIRPAELERVFEPFYTSKAAGAGSGLGLMVARGIAEEHGGELSVQSEVGRGTEFRLRLRSQQNAP
ncbi:MAG: hypothetical protein GY725_08620 [bacterium]|nr:hypothetical protein [bacterium]